MTDAPMRAPLGTRWRSAKIVAITTLTASIKRFLFSLPEPLAHRAGQHVDLRLTAEDGYTAVRSYSIASAPDSSNLIELAIERLDDGEVSPFFHDIAAVGDDIELRGPLGGHFIWSAADAGPLLLIGAGSGVVPLLAMARHRHNAPSNVRAVLLLSARTWDDVPYREELLQLERDSPGFTLILTLTRERARRSGDYQRRIDAAMMTEVITRMTAAPVHVFICGSNAFVNAAADGAVAAGIPAVAIRTERYGA